MVRNRLPAGLTLDDVARLGLRRSTLELIERLADRYAQADRETLAEFCLYLEDERIADGTPAARAWWTDHAAAAKPPERCPRCAASITAPPYMIAGRPAYVCDTCDACVEADE